ncbi:MAG: excisionase [Syntrophus sp. (in: bacteria)]|nr:excisionase [Syntrophus sp. (in: bacteria)]
MNDLSIPNRLFFKPLDVAILFNVSVKTVYSWVAEGKLDAVTIAGRTLRIPYAALNKLIRDVNE